MAEPSAAQLRKQLDAVTLRDAARIGRRLKNLRGTSPEKLRQLADEVAAAQAVIATRHAAVPTITYPDLPVSERRQEIAEAIRAHQVVVIAVPANPPPAQTEAIADIRAQLNRLLPAGFVTATGPAHLADLTRYLLGIRRRLDGLRHAVQADRERMQRVHAVQDAYGHLVHELPPPAKAAADVRDIARQIEELRVSLWAQQLGTPRPVSEQRIYRAIDAARDRW